MHGPEGVIPYLLNKIDDYGRNRRVIVAAEQFVVNGRAGRSRTGTGGQIARDLIGALQHLPRELAPAVVVELHLRAAGAVKPWATDKRLAEAGLLSATQALPHARDAARHALFAAVKTGLMPDPLSAVDPGELSLQQRGEL